MSRQCSKSKFRLMREEDSLKTRNSFLPLRLNSSRNDAFSAIQVGIGSSSFNPMSANGEGGIMLSAAFSSSAFGPSPSQFNSASLLDTLCSDSSSFRCFALLSKQSLSKPLHRLEHSSMPKLHFIPQGLELKGKRW